MACNCKKDLLSMPIKDGNKFYFNTTDFETAVLLEINPYVGTMIRHFLVNGRTYLAGDYLKYVYAFKQDVPELLRKSFKGKLCFTVVNTDKQPIETPLVESVISVVSVPETDVELVYAEPLLEVSEENAIEIIEELVVEKKKRTKKQTQEEVTEDIDK